MDHLYICFYLTNLDANFNPVQINVMACFTKLTDHTSFLDVPKFIFKTYISYYNKQHFKT